jgi:hypothetical protein
MAFDLADAMAPTPGDTRVFAIGVVQSIDSATNRMRVYVDGAYAVLPYMPGTYIAADTVMILRDPYGSGSGQVVIGRFGTPPPPPTPPPTSFPVAPPPPAALPPTTVSASAVILPTWSGSWRSIRSAYDRWNTDQHGGASTLWQGNNYGSGPMTGIAVYGDQVVALGAISIESMTVDLVAADESGTPVLLGTAQSTAYPGAPSGIGPLVNGAYGQTDLVGSGMAELLRNGSVKGLLLVGSNYLGIRGTSLGNGMALRINYTKAA